MPKFTVYVQRKTWEYNSFEVEAPDEQTAQKDAQDIISNCQFEDEFWETWEGSDWIGDVEFDWIQQNEEIISLDDTLLDIPLQDRGFGQ